MKIQPNQNQTAAQNKPAQKKTLTTPKLTEMIKDRLDQIEEMPDYDKRQAETLKLMIKAQGKTKDPAVKDLVRVATVNVHDKSTIYSAMKIGRILQAALVNGAYGNTPLLAKAALDMFETIQFTPQKNISRRILKEMVRQTDDPVAKGAYKMGEEMYDSVFYSYSDNEKVAVTKETLSAVAKGYKGTTEEVLELGTKLSTTAFGKEYEGRKLEPVAKRLIESAENNKEKTHFKYGWELAKGMKGADAEKYFDWLVKNETSIPKGSEGYLKMTEKALESYGDNKHLSESSRDLLKAMSSRFRGENDRKILSLARKLNDVLNPALKEGYYEDESVADTSSLVKTTFKALQNDTPVKTDKDMLSFAKSLLKNSENFGEEGNKEVCKILKGQISDPECKKLLDLTAEVAGQGGNEALLNGFDTAIKSLDGGKPNLISLGKNMAESFRSDYSKAEAYKALFTFMKKQPAYAGSKKMLTLGEAALERSYMARNDKIRAANYLLDRIEKGDRDKNLDMIEFTRDLTNQTTSSESRHSIIEEVSKVLAKDISNPEAKEFFELAQDFVNNCADYAYSCKAFDKALDRTKEIRDGKKFDLIPDALDVINVVPDKLIQANMLRKLDMKYAFRQIKDDKLPRVLEGPIEDLTTKETTSSKRLQLSLDFLNVLSRNAKNPQKAFDLMSEIYEIFPEQNKDIAALSFFHFVTTDPGSDRMDEIRNSYLKPGDWKALQQMIKLSGKEKNSFTLLKKALDAVDGCEENSPRGVISWVMLNEMSKRNITHPGVRKIINDYANQCDKEDFRLNSDKAQSAMLEMIKLMISEITAKDPTTKVVAGPIITKWKQGDNEHNRALLKESLEDIEKFKKGELDSLRDWAAGKLFEQKEPAKPAKKIVKEDDFVIIGGVILPKRK